MPGHKLAVLVPYRDRPAQLEAMLPSLHAFLTVHNLLPCGHAWQSSSILLSVKHVAVRLCLEMGPGMGVLVDWSTRKPQMRTMPGCVRDSLNLCMNFSPALHMLLFVLCCVASWVKELQCPFTQAGIARQ